FRKTRSEKQIELQLLSTARYGLRLTGDPLFKNLYLRERQHHLVVVASRNRAGGTLNTHEASCHRPRSRAPKVMLQPHRAQPPIGFATSQRVSRIQQWRSGYNGMAVFGQHLDRDVAEPAQPRARQIVNFNYRDGL